MDIVTIAARAIFQFLQDDSTVQRAEPVDVRGPDLLRGARSPGWRALGPPLGVDRAAVRATRPSRSELNDTQTLLDLVEVGLGVAVVPEGIAAPRGARIRQIAIRGRRWDWTIAAETLPPGPPSPAARALWAMLVCQDSAADGGG